MRDEPERERGYQLDQAAGQPGEREPRQVSRRSTEGDPEKVRGLHRRGRQRPIEDPGLLPKGAGAIRAEPDAALADRVDFPVAPEHSRQQRHRLAALRTEGQHRVAVAAPPAVLGLERHPPGAHPGRVQDVHQTDRGVGRRPRPGGDLEVDPLSASDDLQGLREGRVPGAGVPVERQVIEVEESLPGGLFRRAAAGRLRALEIRDIHGRQPAVVAFESESGRVEGGERGLQRSLLRQSPGRLAGHCRLAEEGQPARPGQG